VAQQTDDRGKDDEAEACLGQGIHNRHQLRGGNRCG
jgi:hypothetical protein